MSERTGRVPAGWTRQELAELRGPADRAGARYAGRRHALARTAGARAEDPAHALYGSMTQDQIGGHLGISRLQVSRLLSHALGYLRPRLLGSDEATAR